MSSVSGPAYSNSLHKIVYSYFKAFAKKEFTFEGKIVTPPPRTIISPFLWRGFTCPAGCGGCCPKFSLIYLPKEEMPYQMPLVWYQFNGTFIEFFEDKQSANADRFCKNLKKDDGRCGIHGKQPFSCDFELIRLMNTEKESWVGTRLFGRGWNLMRVDGVRGALCTITPAQEETRQDVLRKLRRLKQWMDYCEIENILDEAIAHGESENFMTKKTIVREPS